MIQIGDLDKAAVLAALWNNAITPPAHFEHHSGVTEMSITDAQSHLASQSGFDYLDGRILKLDLSGNEINPLPYDRDNGSGHAARVIEHLRRTGSTEKLT